MPGDRGGERGQRRLICCAALGERWGVEEGEAASLLDVLEYEILKKGRFAGAGLADDIEVSKAIVLLDAKRHRLHLKAFADAGAHPKN